MWVNEHVSTRTCHACVVRVCRGGGDLSVYARVFRTRLGSSAAGTPILVPDGSGRGGLPPPAVIHHSGADASQHDDAKHDAQYQPDADNI